MNKGCFKLYSKREFVNNFFPRCTPIINGNKLPSSVKYIKEKKLNFKDGDVLKIIRSLNVHKAHVRDDISIRSLKIYDAELGMLLSPVFKNYIQYGIFLNLSEKSNMVLIHKKVTTIA